MTWPLVLVALGALAVLVAVAERRFIAEICCMGPAKKKADPISDRSRALSEQIAALEAEIKKLDSQLQHAPSPRLRSTAIPHGATVTRPHEPAPPPSTAARAGF